MTLAKAYDEVAGEPEFSDGLRVAFDTGIKTSSGQLRIDIDDRGTNLYDDDGDLRFLLAGSANSTTGPQFRYYEKDAGNANQLIQDEYGGFSAMFYKPSASPPGTLELDNAELDMSNEAILNIRRLESRHIFDGAYDAGVGDWRLQGHDGQISGFADGDVSISSQDEGGSGAKTATLFDYSAGSISSERYKKDIRTLEREPDSLLDVEAKTWTSDDANAIDIHGFMAEDINEVMPEAVITMEARKDDDWTTQEYLDKHGYEWGDQIPNEIRPIPILAGHHEIIREQNQRIESLEQRVERLESAS